MIYVVVIALTWVVLGAAVGLIEARHGYWHRVWVLWALLGPFALPLAWQRRRATGVAPVELRKGRARRGRVDVLVGIDGSATSMRAAEAAIGLLGPRLGRITLATVLDLDTAAPHADSILYPNPWPEEIAARDWLAAGAAALQTTGLDPSMVVLAGEPADELVRYANVEGYEVVVVGCRGKGQSKLLLGSCASKLACQSAVPVLLTPAVEEALELDHQARRPAGASEERAVAEPRPKILYATGSSAG